MDFEMRPIPKTSECGWTIYIDCPKCDHESDVRFVKMVNPEVGTLTYGWQGRFDGWLFEEIGGGGAATLLWTREGGEIYVGLLLENRANMGGKVYCIPGGFVDAVGKDGVEDHATTQEREIREEVGCDTSHANKLPGLPVNSNRAFFVTDEHTGCKLFECFIPFDYLEECGDDLSLKLKDGLSEVKGSNNLRFFPWRYAVRVILQDALALSAIAKLLSEKL